MKRTGQPERPLGRRAGTQAPDRTRGAAAIEFALILPILVMLVFGIFEFGRVYNAKLTLSNAAREAARSYVINGNDDLFVSIETALAEFGVSLAIIDNCAAADPHVVAEASRDSMTVTIPLIAEKDIALTESVVLPCFE